MSAPPSTTLARGAFRTLDVGYERAGSRKRGVARLAVVLAAVVLLAACGDDAGTTATAGASVFAERCAACHGADGSGSLAPPLTSERMAERFPDSADQEAVVRRGVEGHMPAFEGVLSDAEIEAVIRYTREEL